MRVNFRSGRILAVPDPLLEVRSPILFHRSGATPRSPSPMAMAKNVVRDLAPDPPAEPMHDGRHQAGALLRRKNRDRADGQACEDNYSYNDAP